LSQPTQDVHSNQPSDEDWRRQEKTIYSYNLYNISKALSVTTGELINAARYYLSPHQARTSL